jgi:hypothetical protein
MAQFSAVARRQSCPGFFFVNIDFTQLGGIHCYAAGARDRTSA